MLRAVLDTNIIVSAHLKAESPPSLIVRLVLSGYFHCFISESLFEEYSEVLKRGKFRLEANYVTESLRALRKAAFLVAPLKKLSLTKDPDDNKVVECAMEAGADYIVTGNIRDFPRSYGAIEVFSHENF
jgi:putative PIN family toxin of toxin-antitoxin system